jgi:hypothetical protein
VTDPKELPKLLRYEAGKLYWLPRPEYDRHTRSWNTKNAFNEAFPTNHPHGYRTGHLHGQMQRRGRVVFALHNGYWPKNIDHINGVYDDDRIENLREVTLAENMRNRKKPSNNKTGAMGVAHRGKGYTTYIRVEGDHMYLGQYPTLKRAVSVRLAAETLAKWNGWGFHENHGRD